LGHYLKSKRGVVKNDDFLASMVEDALKGGKMTFQKESGEKSNEPQIKEL
jgi:hypothetical protein